METELAEMEMSTMEDDVFFDVDMDEQPASPFMNGLQVSFVELSIPMEADNDKVELESILCDLELCDANDVNGCEQEEVQQNKAAVMPASSQVKDGDLELAPPLRRPVCHVGGCKVEICLKKCAWKNKNLFRCKREGGCQEWVCNGHAHSIGHRTGCVFCQEQI